MNISRPAAITQIEALRPAIEAIREMPFTHKPGRGLIGPRSQELASLPASGFMRGCTIVSYPSDRYSSLSVLLRTAGLAQCVALGLIDHSRSRHYLAHINHGVSSGELAAHLARRVHLRSCDVYLLPGQKSESLGVVGQVLLGLAQVDPRSLERVRFVHVPAYEGKKHPPIALHRGHIGIYGAALHFNYPFSRAIPHKGLYGGRRWDSSTDILPADAELELCASPYEAQYPIMSLIR